MSEWWSYRPSSFLLFSERTYRRLFERYNAELWPGHLLALALGVGLLVLVLRGGTAALRVALAILAGAWLWTASAFLAERYVSINWAAGDFVVAFALEAVGLLVAAVVGASHTVAASRSGRAIGVGLLGIALAGWPALALLPRRSSAAVEVFGLAPDPTVLATFGVLALLRLHGGVRARWLQRVLLGVLWIVPLAWCAFSTTLLWAMRAPEAALLPLGAGLALVAARRD